MTEHYSSDAREVEDLEARAEMLRRRFLDELPDVQALIGVWGSDSLIGLFDEIDDFGTKIASTTVVALHFKYKDERQEFAIHEAIGEMDRLLELLERAREVLRAAQSPE